jgi:hypothetical protein
MGDTGMRAFLAMYLLMGVTISAGVQVSSEFDGPFQRISVAVTFAWMWPVVHFAMVADAFSGARGEQPEGAE